ncbi:hypothetical protein ILUMI_27501 [Ignelater luminosus]|uniref:Uncharacterized protein n=1 Tax=Ignelater luminosus TaxID=2038154 RepID=A0A8K0C3G9_IGNLU|nr:hypothetical protein ILUMI_27501 [Ignelater luminosus]
MVDDTQDSNNDRSDPKDEFYNMKENFNEKMKEYNNKSGDVIKKPWTNATAEKAIRKILDSNNPETKKTSRQYGLTRKYDIMKIDSYKEREMASEEGENQIANLEQEMCSISSRNLHETSFVSCSSCYMKIYITCCQIIASTSEENNVDYHCDICSRQDKIVTECQKAHEGQKRAAKKMIELVEKN